MAGATFVDCTIALNGGALSACVVRGSTAAIAVSTNDPSKISGCNFVSAGTGHAIEITAPGTYTFAGNTFSGYGSAGTSDAAIYNNSGSAVTLNITAGGGTPTVKNGSGASTTINNTVALTITGVVSGSDIVILTAGTSTERANVDAHSGTSYQFSYAYTANDYVDICLYKAGYVPYVVRNFLLSSTDASLPVAQVSDRNYTP